MFEAFDNAAEKLVSRIRTSALAEAQAAAQMLTAIDELYRLRLRESGDRQPWVVDTVEAVAGEVAAALRISHGLARNHVWHAQAMRERLPKTAELFSAGDIDFLMFRTLVSRTDLITDDDVLAAVDAELALTVTRWPSLSRGQLAGRVDRIVARHDADAVRRRKKKSDDRTIEIWDSGDGLSEIRGFLRNMDGHALNERLDAFAATVCPNDPRTKVQRRADAMGALAAGGDRLACECDRTDCAAAAKSPASPVVIHVVADQATIDGTSDAPGSTVDPDGLIPPELIRELAKSAKQVPLIHPGDGAAECAYAASEKLADFVRCRDMTCRFPGCDRPAVGCDLDHTIPYREGGRTHASNLKCLCRIHHLLKTFCGWRDQQMRDGTVIWTAPSGQTHVTTPGSALWFPSLCRPTGELPSVRRSSGQRGGPTSMMPKRRRTRAKYRALRVADERRRNRQEREVATSKRRWELALSMARDEPPPF